MQNDQTKLWRYFQTNPDAVPMAWQGSAPRLRFLTRFLSRGKRVLNIGIGSGLFEALCLGRDISIHALDPDQNSIDGLRERLHLGDRARVGTSSAIPWPDASMDVVVMSEVLEHLTDEQRRETYREVRRVLVPGGNFIGTVPSNEILAEQRTVCPHCGDVFHRWGHQASFTNEKLSAELATLFSGVRIRERRFVAWGSLNWRGRMGMAVLSVLDVAGLTGSGKNLVFAAST